jgi:hypothetical protein
VVTRRLVALTMTAGLAGCTGDDPEPAATAAGTEAARSQVLAAYDGYQRAQMAALLAGDAEALPLAEFAAEPLLSQTRNSIRQMQEAGVIGRGEQRWSPRVVALNRRSATIEDCADISKWTVVSIATGDRVPPPPEQPDKFIVTSTAKLLAGQWSIVGTDGDWTRPC